MRYFRFIIVGIILLLIVSPSIATDEDLLRQKVVTNFQKLIAKSKIKEPSKDIVTRSSMGSKLYRSVSNGVVLVGTANDVIGSGVVISHRGLVITNWHVVENEPVVGVVFKQAIDQENPSLSEKDISLAKVIKTDPVRDLALLQIRSIPRDLTVLMLGSLPQVEVGQDVFAISHPEGLLWSYTEGVISQIRPNYPLKTEGGTTHKATYIQTQAVASPGSSGGALFDYNGRLIGIIALSLGPGLNFAIAVNEVQGFIMSALEKR
jgi:S1-C subfamily serine protease